MRVRYQVIEQLAAHHSVAELCRLLGVARSGYYAGQGQQPSARQQEDAQLGEEVERLFHQHRGVYGRPRLVAELRARGRRHSGRRVARLMKERKLCVRAKKRFVPRTTDSRHDEPIAPNRLPDRTTKPLAPNQVWVSDLTYIQTNQGWCFLALVMDLASRRIVGWAVGLTLHTSLPLRALAMALQQRRINLPLLHHSDRGVQYASAPYRALLKRHRIQMSMSRPGNPYDNAACESLMSTLKNELIHRMEFLGLKELTAALFEYIEVFYNRTRRHSALGYISPVAYENQLTAKTN